MIVVGVSRHGRVRRLLTGTTGDRIALLAGAIDVHLVTHDEATGSTRSRMALVPVAPPPARRLDRGGGAAGRRWRGSCTCSRTRTSSRWPRCRCWPAPSWSPWSEACSRRCSPRSSASWSSTGTSRRRSAPSPSRSRRTSRRWWSSSRSPQGWQRSWTGPRAGRSRPPRRGPRRPRSARCPARSSPARTPPRRSSSGFARPSARTRSRSRADGHGLERAGSRR